MNKIGFIGFGNIAKMLCEGLLLKEITTSNCIYASALHLDKLKENTKKYNINCCQNNKEVIDNSNIIVLSLKKDDFIKIKDDFINLDNKLVVSVMAGLSSIDFNKWLGNTKIITSLPNVCVSVGSGIFITEINHNLDQTNLDLFTSTFSKLGKIIYLPNDMLDVGTIMAGSTPAYTSMFVEALSEASVNYGISRNISYDIISQMLLGTAKMLQNGVHPGQLKDLVSSPKGLTIKGIIELENNGFRSNIINAIKATQNE